MIFLSISCRTKYMAKSWRFSKKNVIYVLFYFYFLQTYNWLLNWARPFWSVTKSLRETWGTTSPSLKTNRKKSRYDKAFFAESVKIKHDHVFPRAGKSISLSLISAGVWSGTQWSKLVFVQKLKNHQKVWFLFLNSFNISSIIILL